MNKYLATLALLMAAAWAAVIGFATLEPKLARQVEDQVHQKQSISVGAKSGVSANP